MLCGILFYCDVLGVEKCDWIDNVHVMVTAHDNIMKTTTLVKLSFLPFLLHIAQPVETDLFLLAHLIYCDEYAANVCASTICNVILIELKPDMDI